MEREKEWEKIAVGGIKTKRPQVNPELRTKKLEQATTPYGWGGGDEGKQSIKVTTSMKFATRIWKEISLGSQPNFRKKKKKFFFNKLKKNFFL